MTLIDTSVLIAAERGEIDLTSLAATDGGTDPAISAVTASELLHGVHRSAKPEHRALREAFVEQVLTRLPVLPFDLTAARIHAHIWSELASKGIAAGAHDLLIAATAFSFGASIATRDERSFRKFPGVSLLLW